MLLHCNQTLLNRALPRSRPTLRLSRRATSKRAWSRATKSAALQSEGGTAIETAASSATAASADKPITLSDQALRHLKRLREDSGGEDLLLRVGVKSGGCSGLSYAMDFEQEAAISKEDTVVEYEGFRLVTDAMSLLYLFGMTLDYSNKLIGGGFIFQNPNAQSSCGCGKSFGV